MTNHFNLEHTPKGGYTLRVPLNDAQAEMVRTQTVMANRNGNSAKTHDSEVLELLLDRALANHFNEFRSFHRSQEGLGAEEFGQARNEAREQLTQLSGNAGETDGQ